MINTGQAILSKSSLARALMDPSMDLNETDEGKKKEQVVINRIKKLDQRTRDEFIVEFLDISSSATGGTPPEALRERGLCVPLLTDNGLVVEQDGYGKAALKTVGTVVNLRTSSQAVVDMIKRVRAELFLAGAESSPFDYKQMRKGLKEYLKNQPVSQLTPQSPKQLEMKAALEKLLSLLQNFQNNPIYLARISAHIKNSILNLFFQSTLRQIEQIPNKAWGQLANTIASFGETLIRANECESPELIDRQATQAENIFNKIELDEADKAYLINLVAVFARAKAEKLLQNIEREKQILLTRHTDGVNQASNKKELISSRLQIAKTNKEIEECVSEIGSCLDDIKAHSKKVNALDLSILTIEQFMTDPADLPFCVKEAITLFRNDLNKDMELHQCLTDIAHFFDLPADSDQAPVAVGAMLARIDNIDDVLEEDEELKTRMNAVRRSPQIACLPQNRILFISDYFRCLEIQFSFRKEGLEESILAAKDRIETLTKRRELLLNPPPIEVKKPQPAATKSIPAPVNAGPKRPNAKTPALEPSWKQQKPLPSRVAPGVPPVQAPAPIVPVQLQPSTAPKQEIVVTHVARSPGDCPHIYGKGPGMSWSQGIPMVRKDDNQWAFELPEAVAANFVYKIVLHTASGQKKWELLPSNGNRTFNKDALSQEATPIF